MKNTKKILKKYIEIEIKIVYILSNKKYAKFKEHKNRMNSRFERGVVKLDEYKSFEEVYIEYDQLVFNVAMSYFNDSEIAREITNDVWVEYAEALRKTRRKFFY